MKYPVRSKEALEVVVKDLEDWLGPWGANVPMGFQWKYAFDDTPGVDFSVQTFEGRDPVMFAFFIPSSEWPEAWPIDDSSYKGSFRPVIDWVLARLKSPEFKGVVDDD